MILYSHEEGIPFAADRLRSHKVKQKKALEACAEGFMHLTYRGDSKLRTRTAIGPYDRAMPGSIGPP